MIDRKSVPLLPEQRRFLTRGLPGENHWNQAAVCSIPTWIGADLLGRAAAVVCRRHEALRVLLEPGSADVGWISDPASLFEVTDVDLTGESDTRVFARECDRIQESLDLRAGPLIRLARIGWARGEARLLIVVHHFLVDGVGLGILIGDLEQVCIALSRGEPIPSARPAPGAHEFAAWLEQCAETPAIRAEVDAWERIGRPVEPVRLDRDAPNTMATTEIVTRSLGAETTRAVMDLVRGKYRGNPTAVLLSAIGPTIRPSGDALRTNLIGHGRSGLPDQPRVTRTVGWLSTRYPVTFEFLPDRHGIADRAAAIAAQLHEIPNSGTGFGLLRYLSRDAEIRGRLAALGEPDITLNIRGGGRGPEPQLFQPAAEPAGESETSTGFREHVHGIDIASHGGELQLVWYFSSTQFDRTTIEDYCAEVADRLRSGLVPQR
ncbi:condensation domain-containing protein [Nocardia sp. NPDC003999]